MGAQHEARQDRSAAERLESLIENPDLTQLVEPDEQSSHGRHEGTKSFHIVAEHFAETSRLYEIALDVDHD